MLQFKTRVSSSLLNLRDVFQNRSLQNLLLRISLILLLQVQAHSTTRSGHLKEHQQNCCILQFLWQFVASSAWPSLTLAVILSICLTALYQSVRPSVQPLSDVRSPSVRLLSTLCQMCVHFMLDIRPLSVRRPSALYRMYVHPLSDFRQPFVRCVSIFCEMYVHPLSDFCPPFLECMSTLCHTSICPCHMPVHPVWDIRSLLSDVRPPSIRGISTFCQRYIHPPPFCQACICPWWSKSPQWLSEEIAHKNSLGSSLGKVWWPSEIP